MTLTKKQRAELREMFGGRCAYCGVELNGKWHGDHVEPLYRQPGYVRKGFRDIVPDVIVKARLLRPHNDRDDNLFPACIPCNIDKGVESIEDWREWLQEGMVRTMRDNIANFRHAERFRRLTINTEPIVFWLETYRAEQAAKQEKT